MGHQGLEDIWGRGQACDVTTMFSGKKKHSYQVSEGHVGRHS